MNNFNPDIFNNNDWSKVTTKSKKKIKSHTNNSNHNNHNNQNNHNHNYFDDFSDNEFDINIEKNKKKILCNNTIKNIPCTYGTKCLYAHCISEQKMDDNRKKSISAIQDEFDLSYLNFNNEEHKPIIKTFLLLTNLCTDCQNKKCPGGVNCKFGAYDKAIQICYDDLTKGSCKINNCNKIHLSERGFKCLNEYKVDKKKKPIKFTNYTTVYIPEPFLLNDEFFRKINKSINSSNYENLDTSPLSSSNISPNNLLDSCEESIFS